ncbi:MAG: hypothetical protein ACFE85_16355 [Candidatus Hodarchaeota archaeon]
MKTNEEIPNHKETNNQESFLSLINLKHLLLSHHPNCDKFLNHTINIGNYRFCIGCFIGYSTAIIGIFTIGFLKLVNILDSISLFFIALILMASFLLSPLNLTTLKIIKIIQKFLIGLGSSFLFWWIRSLPNPIHVNIIFLFSIFGPIIAMLNAYHAYGLYKTCKKCEYAMKWNACPGFK